MDTIKPTITAEQASASDWDVVVIGAGPAGAIAARAVAMSGSRVLLVDKASFPRDKVCGGCVNNAALHMLESQGLGDLPLNLGGKPTRQLLLAAGGHQVALALPPGVAVSRRAFDAALVQAALQAGAEFLPVVNARLAGCLANRQELRLAGQSVRSGAVVVADGLGATSLVDRADFHTHIATRSRVGAGTIIETGEAGMYSAGIIHMACGCGGYVGAVRTESNRLNIAAAFDPQFVRRYQGFGPAVQRTLASAGLPVPSELVRARWRGTPMLTVRRRPVARGRVFLIGDSARYVEPFTGEGMAWAIASGLAVAPLAIASARQWSPQLAAEWIKQHEALVGRRSLRCRLITYGLRNHLVTVAALGLLSYAPSLANPMLRSIARAPVIPAVEP